MHRGGHLSLAVWCLSCGMPMWAIVDLSRTYSHTPLHTHYKVVRWVDGCVSVLPTRMSLKVILCPGHNLLSTPHTSVCALIPRKASNKLLSVCFLPSYSARLLAGFCDLVRPG